MSISRRAFLGGSLAAGAAAATAIASEALPASATPLPPGKPDTGFFTDLYYRLLVPEIYATPPALPSKNSVVIIGTGFGAAVTALRLTQAGVTVHMLERGSQWPGPSATRQIFSGDTLPDGRALWYRTSFTGVNGIPLSMSRFGGVLDASDYANIQVWRGAAVGGGSIVFTGALVQPEQRFFDHVFQGTVSYAEMNAQWYPKALAMLRGSTMPADVLASAPFGHSREWNRHATLAGYTPQAINSIFNWDVIRKELSGADRASAIRGESNYGNSDGAKYDLTQNYLAQAQATGRLTIHPRHVVNSIGSDGSGYWINYTVINPNGTTVSTATAHTSRLFLGAGSIGTSELLVRASATGAMPKLNQYVGQGWGTNGDAALVQAWSPSAGVTQASPSASRILDETGMPVTLENWFVPGIPVNLGMLGSLGMTLDDTRGSLSYVASSDTVQLNWGATASAESDAALAAVQNKIAAAAGVTTGFPPFAPAVNSKFTAHPLGGAVIGKVSDAYGRVDGYPGLYVVDGAGIPGSTGTVNPSLTITALAERNIANIIAAGA